MADVEKAKAQALASIEKLLNLRLLTEHREAILDILEDVWDDGLDYGRDEAYDNSTGWSD